MMDASAFPVTVEIPVQWGEMDSFGHVNNTIYFRYFETARITYFERAGFTASMKRDGIGPILASTKCRFRSPVIYPDKVIVGVSAIEMKDDRFTMVYAVWSDAQQKIAADGEGLIVAYDYKANQKAQLPTAVREAITKIQTQPSATSDG